MPIKTLRARLPKVGEIRLGVKVDIPDEPGKKAGRTRPEKLDVLRFSSGDEALIRQLAGLYGGIPEPWVDAPTPGQFQVVTSTTKIDVYVPPTDMALSQWMEHYEGPVCLRRCDTEDCSVPRKVGDKVSMVQLGTCLCRDEGEEICKPATRLSLVLADLPSTGVFKLLTHGWNAAGELDGVARLLRAAQVHDRLVPATLRTEWRKQIRQGAPTLEYVVPVLDIATSVAELFAGTTATPIGGPAAALAPGQPALGAANDHEQTPDDRSGVCADHKRVANIELHYAQRRNAGRPCSSDPEREAERPGDTDAGDDPGDAPVDPPGPAGSTPSSASDDPAADASPSGSEPAELPPTPKEFARRLNSFKVAEKRELDERARLALLPPLAEYSRTEDYEVREAMLLILRTAEEERETQARTSRAAS